MSQCTTTDGEGQGEADTMQHEERLEDSQRIDTPSSGSMRLRLPQYSATQRSVGEGNFPNHGSHVSGSLPMLPNPGLLSVEYIEDELRRMGFRPPFPAPYPEGFGHYYPLPAGKMDHAAFRQAKRRLSDAAESVWCLFEADLNSSDGSVYAYHIPHQPEWKVPTEVSTSSQFKRVGPDVVTEGMQGLFFVAMHATGVYATFLRDTHAVDASDFKDRANRLCAARVTHLEAMTDEQRAQLPSQYDAFPGSVV